MAALYSNENFPIPVVEELRHLGHDVLTVLEAGKADQSISDEDVLDYAIGLGRGVLTLNRKHFIRLHHSATTHAGIVVCTFDPDFSRQAQRIHLALTAAGDIKGKLVRVNRPE